MIMVFFPALILFWLPGEKQDMPNLVSSNSSILKEPSDGNHHHSSLDIVTDTDKRTLECSNTNIVSDKYLIVFKQRSLLKTLLELGNS